MEFRLSTPEDWRLRGIIGAYVEDDKVYAAFSPIGRRAIKDFPLPGRPPPWDSRNSFCLMFDNT